jgi:integrase/recombinase XerD
VPDLVLPPARPVTRQDQPSRLWNATLGWLAHQPSEATRVAYNRGLTGLSADGSPAKMLMPGWLPWLAERGVTDPLAVTLDVVDVYARVMAGTGMAKSSQAQRLALISSWYMYLIDARLTSHNPVGRASRPQVAKAETSSVSLSEAETIRLLAQAEAEGPMAYALEMLLYFGGYRIGGVVAANIGDLGWEQDKATGADQRTLRMTLKRGKVKTKIVEAPAAAAVDAWLATRPGAGPAEPLFIGPRAGRRLLQQSAWALVRRLARQAGIRGWDQVNNHTVRHTHIDAALAAGVPVHVLAASVDHAQVTTTMDYANLLDERANRSGATLAANWLSPGTITHPETTEGTTAHA